jgi:hypothetical protein
MQCESSEQANAEAHWPGAAPSDAGIGTN